VLEILGDDCVSFCAALFRTALAAENLFQRKHLTTFRRKIRVPDHLEAELEFELAVLVAVPSC
jgi:hypothetical protein